MSKRVHGDTVRRQSNNRYLIIDGEHKTLREWSEETGVDETLIWHRLKKGWDPERAVYQLPRKYAKRVDNNS